MSRIILQPSGNKDAREHYINTIKNPVHLEAIKDHLSIEQYSKLRQIYANGLVPTWGVTEGFNSVNKNKWNKISVGDVSLFSANGFIFASGVVTYKLHNRELAKQLWGVNGDSSTWEYIYFLDEIKNQKISYREFNAVAEYAENNIIQGFSVLDELKSENILSAFALISEEYIPTIEVDEYRKVIEQFDPNLPLDTEAKTKIRKEQSFLRGALFSNRKVHTCGICNKEYPIDLLVAAHIKKRSHCTVEEKLDYKNIVMPICKMGCDDLFEKGYISVRNGKVVKRNNIYTTNALEQYISSIVGVECCYFNEETKKYFEWHENFHFSDGILSEL